MPADHPLRGASKVLPTGFPLVRVLTATANAHYRPTFLTTAAIEMRLRFYFPVFELSMYIDKL